MTLGETFSELAPVAGVVVLVVPALWAWMLGVQRRGEAKVDAANKERDTWAARWAREVDLGAQRAMDPAPRRAPVSLPPPSFGEPDEIRAKREELERARLEIIRQGDAESELDKTLTIWLKRMSVPPPPR